jgi:hypothetical protein
MAQAGHVLQRVGSSGLSGMTVKRFSLPVFLLALALTFALGSVGSATASGLTKGAVKKIATKVVAKKAPTLSVAHASTADNANNANTVGGATATQLGVRPVVYTKSSGSVVSGGTISLPNLPGGSYVFLENVFDFGGASTYAQCDVWDATTSTYLLIVTEPAVTSQAAVTSGGGFLTVPAGHQTQMKCFGSATLNASTVYPWSFTFIPVASSSVTAVRGTEQGSAKAPTAP